MNFFLLTNMRINNILKSLLSRIVWRLVVIKGKIDKFWENEN